MSALPVTIDARAAEDVAAVAVELRPAVFEHLARIGVNHLTCSRRCSFPRPPGLESGLWVRHADGRGSLLEVLFFITELPTGLTVRRVLVTAVDRLPGWVVNPSEWPGDKPWPVVDI